MHQEPTLEDTLASWHGSVRSYVTGLVICVVLTALSFSLVAYRLLDAPLLHYAVGALALVQAGVQLRLFLHLGKEKDTYWELIMFASMLVTLLVIVLGSLWVMNDLNARMMTMDMVHE